ncbi:MAG TPA: M1 family metallopeptidase [Gemmatimonadaceae bacterium]|nr:M1 family metallopeptidase [Gemmatimonadaceae bacterium]
MRHALAALLGLCVAASPSQAQARLPSGRPGPGYWQQQVDYSIDVALEPGTRELRGSGRVVYHNNSPDTLRELHWHLYQNVFRPDSGGSARRSILGLIMPTTRGITVTRLAARGRELAREIDRTLMRTPLAEPLTPGDSLAIDVAWELEVPPSPAIRTGARGGDFGIAQWYPQVAAYDDVHGWDTTQYDGAGEFYLEYGDWDVRIGVPAGMLVAATGMLQNAADVLTPAQRARLDGARAGSVAHVVTPDEVRARRRGDGGGTRSWRFVARGVRDFAWAASPRFVWDATRTAPNAAQPAGVLVSAVYRDDEARDYEGSAALARQAVEYWSERFGPYLWPQVTLVSGPVEGMEYPTLAFGGPASRLENYPVGVILHELGHQWYPMMLGTHETRFPAMDEGMTTFITTLAQARLLGPNNFWSPRLPLFLRGVLGAGDERRWLAATYLVSTGGAGDLPLLTHAHEMDAYQLGLLVYTKMSSALFLLRDVLGAETLERAMREYHARWALRHPYPEDFFRTVENVSGRDLEWFWQQWFRETRVADVAVAQVDTARSGDSWTAEIRLANRGTAAMPVTVALTLRDGSVRTLRVDETAWGDWRDARAVRGSFVALRADSLPAPVVKVEADPAQVVPDVRRRDNVWPRGAEPAAGPLLGARFGDLARMTLVALVALALARAAGHLAAARLAGFRTMRYAVGHTIVWSTGRGFGLHRDPKPRLWDDSTAALPPAGLESLGRRTAVVAAGKALGALALALGSVAALAALEGAYRAGLRDGSRFHLDTQLFAVGALGLLALLLGAMPRPTRGFVRRGAWLPALLLGGERAERWGRILALRAAAHAGVPPRDWDAEWVTGAARRSDGSRAEAGACLLAYHWALDRGDLGAAAAFLQRARGAAVRRGWLRGRIRRAIAEERHPT